MTESHSAPTPRLQLLGVSKAYGSVVANDAVSLTVLPGEIHAVLGENGAGKSTLMKIIYGVTQPDCGDMVWQGKQVKVANPAAARKLGIGMVFQHFALFETLSVAENISLALDERTPMAALNARISQVSQQYGLTVEPDRLVHSMSVGERQRVEIVRCLLQSPRLLIMDEPTSVLTPQAVQKLFESLRRLAKEGCSILYISHKLDEIQSLCDRATVLRSGRVSGTALPKQSTARALAELMIGKELTGCQLLPRVPAEPHLVLQRLCQATSDPFGTTLKNIDLAVHSGEIVGIAGISGNGQQELLKVISGETRQLDDGSVQICGTACAAMGPQQRRAAGLGFVPEERLGRGAVPVLNLADNALLTGYVRGPSGSIQGDPMLRRGLVQHKVVTAFAQRVIERFAVKCGGTSAMAGSLSGGNLQKFIVGRETLLAPRVMVIAQPTWGVDIGASMLIRQAMIDLRDQGVAVLVISEELDELFMISDRIAVLADGRLSRALPLAQTSLNQVGLWMSGDFSAGVDAPVQPDSSDNEALRGLA